MDRKFILIAIIYAVIGMTLGMVMAASKNHGQMTTHAHIILVGFVVPFIYALCHRLWLNNGGSVMAKAQFYIHQLGIFVMALGLFLRYGGFIEADKIEPLLASSSILVTIAMLLMAILFIQSGKSTADG